jgi:hypothetical protein
MLKNDAPTLKKSTTLSEKNGSSAFQKNLRLLSGHIFATGFFRVILKPHCIQSNRVFAPAGTSKSTSRCHGIQAVTRVMAYVADAVTL